MALLKLTALNAGIKGSIAGTTFQGSISGQVIKTKPVKGTKDSNGKLTHADAGRFLQSKRHITTLSTKWRLLSNQERASWETGAINYPFINKWNETYTGSGFQVYMQVNTNLLNTNYPSLNSCPPPSTVYNAPFFQVLTDPANGTMKTNEIEPDINFQTQFFATRSLSLGRKVVASDFKCILKLDIQIPTVVNLANEYQNVFGHIPITGNIWFKTRTPNFINGRSGIQAFYQSVF